MSRIFTMQTKSLCSKVKFTLFIKQWTKYSSEYSLFVRVLYLKLFNLAIIPQKQMNKWILKGYAFTESCWFKAIESFGEETKYQLLNHELIPNN